jgi:hypothetical protein
MGKLAFVLLLSSLLITGCCRQMDRATSSLTPGADLSRVKNIYLIPRVDDNENYLVIQKNLERRGYLVTVGHELPLPYKTDVVVDYLDKWMWDITPFVLELTITIRNPTSNFPMAVGNSYHPRPFNRRSMEEMTEEVLTNIFSTKSNSQID